MLRFNLIISAYCWLTVVRNNRISSVMPCNTFDMSVTCSFIGIKVQRKSEIRKKNKHIYSLYTKILEERIQTGQYRRIVTPPCNYSSIMNVEYQLLLSGKNKLKALYLFIHRYCSHFTHPEAWFSVSNCKYYKMHLFWQEKTYNNR